MEGLAVTHHEGPAVRGVVGVDRDDAAAGAGDGEHGGHRLGGSPHQADDPAVRGDTVVQQASRAALHHRVQLGVRGAARALHHGDRVRCQGRVPAHQRVQRPLDPDGSWFAFRGSHRHRRRDLVRQQDRDATDGDGQVGRHRVDDGDDPLEQRRRRGTVVEVDGVGEVQTQGGAGGFVDHQLEVVLGAAGVEGERLEDDVADGRAQVGGGARGDHDVEERVSTRQPRRVDGVDERLERQVRPGEGVEVGRTDGREMLAQGAVAGGGGTQHHGVDEHAQDAVEVRVPASGDGGAHGDVVPGAEPTQHEDQGGVHDHEP